MTAVVPAERAGCAPRASASTPLAAWLRGPRFLPVVLGGYLLLRLFSFVLLTWVAGLQDPAGIPGGPAGERPGYLDMTRVWDGDWYRRIVVEGYPQVLPRDAAGVLQQNQWAFYPLFPLATRALMALTGGSFALVASTLALLLGAAAAAVAAVLLRDRVGPVAAAAGVWVLAASPPSPVLQMAYTESAALLLLCWYLLMLDRRRWGPAAVAALLLGLTRPVALPLAAVAAVAVLARWRERRERPLRPAELAGMAATGAACAVSGLLWPAVAAWVTGERDAYTATMSTWRAGAAIVPLQPLLVNARRLMGDVGGIVFLVVVVAVVAAALLGRWARGLGPVLRAWTAAYLGYLAVVLDPGTSIYRYLLLAFPLVVVAVGGGWAHQDEADLRARLLPARTAVLVALGLAWQVWWVWELLRIVPPFDNPI